MKDTAIMLVDNKNVLFSLSYDEMYSCVHQIKANLKQFLTEDQSDCIGLLMKHNVYLPAIILSLNQLGQCFTFVELRHLNRLTINWILTENDSTVDLSSFSIQSKFKLLNNKEFILLKRTNSQTIGDYNDIFCVLQSSGTTGDCKTIQVTNHCIKSNAANLRQLLKVTKNDSIFWGTPLTFDPAMIELLISIEAGATLVIVPDHVKMNPNLLFTTLFHPKSETYTGITFLQSVPSLFLRFNPKQIHTILNISQLKVLGFGGESFPQEILNYPRKPDLKLVNLYGISELSCWSTMLEISDEKFGDEIAIGEALSETLVEVRRDGCEIREGEGDIFVGSSTRFCLVDGEKLPFRATGDMARIQNNRIFYVGRTNSIFKRFGLRINLERIEKTVTRLTGLENKCVFCADRNKLLLFVCLEDYDPKTKMKVIDKLRVKLINELAPENVPDFIEALRTFPLSCHGKVDRKALKAMFDNSSSNLQREVDDVFSSILLKYFGAMRDKLHFNFFEIGGNSILAMQLLDELKQSAKSELPEEFLQMLFRGSLKECLELLGKMEKLPLVVPNKRLKIDEINSEHLRVLWKKDLKACVDSGPLVFNNGATTLVAIGSFANIFSIFDLSGQVIFEFAFDGAIESPPCVNPDSQTLYLPCLDGNLYCINYQSGEIKWKYTAEDAIKCTPCLCNNSETIAFGAYDKKMHCIDVQTGTIKWKTHVSEGICSNPLNNPKERTIITATIMGTCLCMNETSGDILWRFKSSSPIFGSPCFLDDDCASILFPGVKGDVYCIRDGKLLWKFTADGLIYSSIQRYKNYFYFSCHDFKLYFIQATNNASELVKTFTHHSAISSSAFVTTLQNTEIIVSACNSGYIYVIDFRSGVILSSLQLANEVFSSPVMHGNKIFVGCRDDFLYCIEIKF